jgi:sulfide dehydrogenase cytochrome subunit
MRSARSLVTIGGLMILVGVALLPALGRAADPQVLASSCSGCHTNSDSERLKTAIPKIRGLPEAVIVEAMQAFRTGRRPATVMDRIAKGFTDDEIKQLAAYFSAHK